MSFYQFPLHNSHIHFNWEEISPERMRENFIVLMQYNLKELVDRQ